VQRRCQRKKKPKEVHWDDAADLESEGERLLGMVRRHGNKARIYGLD
jgi:hypothetical protein